MLPKFVFLSPKKIKCLNLHVVTDVNYIILFCNSLTRQLSGTMTPQMPVIPTNFPDLDKFSIEELEEFENDSEALEAWVEKLEMAS